MIKKTESEIMATWKSEYNNVPIVSVRCMTYNHEKYIENALDSFLMQETNFPFEIIVHDDCSKDRTAEIIEEYAKCYPNIIRAMYENENQYSKPGGSLLVSAMVKQACRGKYIAICEGDDYWLVTDKLQKQYDLLKNNPKIAVCVCKTYIDVGDSCQSTIENYIPPQSFDIGFDNIINGDELAKYVFGDISYPFHTSSYFFKKEFDLFEDMEGLRGLTEGDEILLRKAIAFGGVYYINEVMSCYRWLAAGGWTAAYFKKTCEEQYNHAKNQAKANNLFDKITDYKYHELIRKKNFKMLMQWIFLTDTTTVARDINEIVGKDIVHKCEKKERIAYVFGSKYPKISKVLYKIYNKIRG